MSTTNGPVPFLDLGRQYREIDEEVKAAIEGVMSMTNFIGGPAVAEFERAFGDFIGADFCIGVANGTDALEIALEALDFSEPGEVIVPAASFIATSEAVSRSGHDIVFADVDEATYVLDPNDVRKRITSRTRAIIPVHLFGHPAPMPELLELAEPKGLMLIEDCAQAHGAEIEGSRVGTFGVAATFSFYPGKNLGAYGDAGALTTADEDLAKRVRMIANHGRVSKYQHEFEGRNSRLDAIQAAVLSVKLHHLEKWTERRRSLAEQYREGLRGVGDLILPVERDLYRHVYHLFVIRSGSRDELQAALAEGGIATGVHYPRALPQLAAYSEHPQHQETFFANSMADEVLSLPMGDSIDSGQVDRVIDNVRKFFSS